MSVSAFTSRGENVALEDFPSFCVIRDDIIEDGDRVPVGNQYIRKDKIYLSAWDINDNFYIVIGGLLHEAESIDFDYPSLETLKESNRGMVA